MKKIILLTFVIGGICYADSDFDTKLGTVEVGGGGGVAFLPGNTAHGVAYGRTTVSLHKAVALFGEFGFMPGPRESDSIYGVPISASANVLSYSGGVQVQIPTGTSARPYVMAGVGSLNARAAVNYGPFKIGLSESAFTYNFGGGTKLFITPKLGFDIGVRAYRPHQGSYGASGIAAI